MRTDHMRRSRAEADQKGRGEWIPVFCSSTEYRILQDDPNSCFKCHFCSGRRT